MQERGAACPWGPSGLRLVAADLVEKRRLKAEEQSSEQELSPGAISLHTEKGVMHL